MLIMPELDGVEVSVKLANRNCRAKIIITSERSANEHGLDIAGVHHGSKRFIPRIGIDRQGIAACAGSP
jgi:hypothetical protein